jgi:hypothetical protein
MKVRFPDGTEIQARGGAAGIIDFDDHETPDWALYLDEQWRHRGVGWSHEIIDWTDFGLPSDERALFEAITRAWNRARRGEVVEIACDGGTGRTGTAVACLAILSGVPLNEVVRWTRENYHHWAVEVPEQEGMIVRFGAWLKGNGGKQ